MNNILIIGAGGFFGSRLFESFTNNGFLTYGLSHSTLNKKNIFPFSLNDTIPSEILEKEYCAIIYLVHLYEKDKEKYLFDWYCKTFKIFERKSAKQIYISSYSANEYAESNYGKIKYKIEQFFLNNSAYTISPGLIVGNGGIYKKIYNAVKNLPIIISPTIKSSTIPLIEIENLCSYILDVVKEDNQEKKHTVYSEFISLTNLIKRVLSQLNQNKIVIEINAYIVLFPMIFAEKIGIKLPVSSDSLIGFIKNQKINPEN